MLELVTNGERRRIPVTLTSGGQVSHYFDLPQTSPTGTGSLQIRTDPPKARVTVDGQPFGRTPTVVTGLTPGPHQVLLETDTERVSEQVLIEAGGTASLVVPMKSQSSSPRAAGPDGLPSRRQPKCRSTRTSGCWAPVAPIESCCRRAATTSSS